MKYIVIILMLGLFFSGCNSWLNVEPQGERLSEEYWKKTEDVQNTMMSAYVRLRACMPKMLEWGELRGDVLNIRSTDYTIEIDEIKNQNITTENGVISWGPFYKVINSANAVIKYAPLVLERDPLFTETMLDQYVAEAKVVRSMAYFYLIRAFREVPLILEPYTTDQQNIYKAKNTEREIIDQILLDLKWAMKRVRTQYHMQPSYWENKARATRWAAQTLLADVYLWDEKYGECVNACNVIINGGKYKLLAENTSNGEDSGETIAESWFDLYYPGLSDESIWEIYYDQGNNQSNSLKSWFDKDGRYFLNSKIKEVDLSDKDLRGKNNTYWEQDGWLGLWKYVGTQSNGTSKRSGNINSPNWILYRYADVLLMQAEAYCMMGMQYNVKAIQRLNQIKNRAGISTIDEGNAGNYSQAMLLQEIMDERKREFAGEGKRWFDLLRFAKKKDFSVYKSDVIRILMNNVPISERPIYEAKLANSWSFYFPIHKDEISLGKGLLKQNPAYE